MLFWVVIGAGEPFNPAAVVRGPKHGVKVGMMPVLERAKWRQLLDAVPTKTARYMRDRTLIAILTYSFACAGSALNIAAEHLIWLKF